LPVNIELSVDLDRVLQRIYLHSATFRAQCERIAANGNLQVRMRIDTLIPSSYRAYTIFSRRGREILADVRLPPGAHLAEFVAHEFEHILEQLDGLNLRRLAGVKGSGVQLVDRDLYETERADAAGRLVAEELLRETRARVAD
jgi:hypothetical protein